MAEKNEIVTEEKELARLFNDHHTNIVERSCKTKPTNVVKEQKDNRNAVDVICKSFANHESTIALKEDHIEKFLTAGNNYFPKVSACDVKQLWRNIDSKKFADIDKIPRKLIVSSNEKFR